MTAETIRERLKYLRGELRAERISLGELHELQDLAPHIEPGDVELLEAAGVPENATETRHTPGPWTCDRMLIPARAKDRRCGFVVNGPDDNGEPPMAKRICDLRVPRGIDGFAEGEANARLIAAAPELLAALRVLVRAWERGERMHHGDPQSFDDPIGQARLALRKATT